MKLWSSSIAIATVVLRNEIQDEKIKFFRLFSCSNWYYTIVVTDSAGCMDSAQVTVNDPSAFNLSFSSTNATCNGYSDGTVTVFVSGGTPPYVFNWSTGGISQTEPCLKAGLYIVAVFDSNGCLKTDSVTIKEPPAMIVTITLGPPGTATANVSGGIPPCSYLWSNGEDTQTATELGEGKYSVSVTDGNWCTWSAEVITGSRIISATPLEVDVFPNPTSDQLNVHISSPSAQFINITL